MFAIGDVVVFTLDGARGIVIRVEPDRCQVLWEDHFVSWERIDCLRKEGSARVGLGRPGAGSPEE